MKARLLLLTLAVTAAANAQISLATLTGTTQTPIGASYTFASLAPNVTEDVTFVAINSTSAAVTLTKLAIAGIGFAIVNTPTLPITIAPGSKFNFFVRFTGGPVGNYSANLQVSTIIVALQGAVVQAVTLSVAAPCVGPDVQGNISFGRIPQTQQVTCTFTLSNPYTQALTVSPLAVGGSAFKLGQVFPVSIPAGQSISFPVIFTAATASAYTGTFTVGVQTYALSGTGFLSPLPPPLLSFGATTLESAKQYFLTATLPSPATATLSGSITMTFTPAVNGVPDDAAVRFVATSQRFVSFGVVQGSTTLLFNNQTGIAFSTGTTAGTITFTVDAGTVGVSGGATTTATIAPAPLVLTAASATSTANLEVTLTGYDNTYTVGPMVFTFYDRSGNALGSPIQADFSSSFRDFFQGQTLGSAFLVRVSFPVVGSVASVGSVDVQLTNVAGSTTVKKLTFP